MGQLFIDVVQGVVKETCPLEDAILSDTVSHMGNIAIREDQKITWDPARGEIVNDPDAKRWFVRKMRDPYSVG